MNLDTLQISLELIVVMIGIYLAFFKSYFKEKGKNIALKEDIEEITEKIETVRNQIYFSTESKLSLKIEERNALVNSYERYHLWLKIITDINLFTSSIKDPEHIDRFKNKIHGAYFNCELAQGRMEVFVNNDNINELLAELIVNTLKLQHLIEEKLINFKQLLLDSTRLDQQGEGQKKFLEEHAKLLEEYRIGVLERYEQLTKSHKRFQVVVYSHLQNLLEK